MPRDDAPQDATPRPLRALPAAAPRSAEAQAAFVRRNSEEGPLPKARNIRTFAGGRERARTVVYLDPVVKQYLVAYVNQEGGDLSAWILRAIERERKRLGIGPRDP